MVVVVVVVPTSVVVVVDPDVVVVVDESPVVVVVEVSVVVVVDPSVVVVVDPSVVVVVDPSVVVVVDPSVVVVVPFRQPPVLSSKSRSATVPSCHLPSSSRTSGVAAPLASRSRTSWSSSIQRSLSLWWVSWSTSK